MKLSYLLVVLTVVGLCGLAEATLVYDYSENPIGDATVDSLDLTIRGDEEVLMVQGFSDDIPFYSLGSWKRTYLKFDLSQIPDDAEIVSARFGIYFFEGNGPGGNTMDPSAALYLVEDDTWQEMTVTWDTKPDNAAGYIDDTVAMTVMDPVGYHYWNLLSDLGENLWSSHAADLQDDILSLMLVTSDEDQNNFAKYNSREAATMPPVLEIIYVPEPLTIALLGLGGLFLRRRR